METGIALVDDDWAAVSPRPLLLTKNFTVTGRSLEEPVDLWLNFVGPYVQLAPGGRLTLRAVVLHDWRRGSATQAPGFDLLATIPLDPLTPPVVVLDHVVLAWPYCGQNDVRSASVQSLSRPASLPGENQYTQLADGWQPGCRNATAPMSILYTSGVMTQAALPAVRALERCWARASYLADFGTYGVVVDSATARPSAAGYLILIEGTYSVCNLVIDSACITKLGPLGCELYMQAQWRQHYQQQGANNASATAVGSVQQQVGRSSSSNALGPALGAALGGAALALIVVAGLAARMVVRRRRLKTQQCARAQQGKATTCGEQSPVVGRDGKGGMQLVHTAAGGSSSQHTPLAVPSIALYCVPEAEAAGDLSAAVDTVRSDTSAAASLVTPATPQRPHVAMGVQLVAASSLSRSLRVLPAFSPGNDCGHNSSSINIKPTVVVALGSPIKAAAGLALVGSTSALPTATVDLTRGVSLPVATAYTAGMDSMSVRTKQDGSSHGPSASSDHCRDYALSDAVRAKDACEVLDVAANSGNQVVLLPRVLGRGAFGRVHEGLFRGQKVAVKVFSDAIFEAHGRSIAGCSRSLEAKPHAQSATRPNVVAPGRQAAGSGGSRLGTDEHKGATSSGLVTGPGQQASSVLHGRAMVEPDLKANECATAVKKGSVRTPASTSVNGVEQGCAQERVAASFAREVEVLSRAEHPGIVRLLAACLTPPRACLVMELMETNLEAMLYGSSALEARIKERPAAPVEDTKAGVNDGVDGAPGHEPGRSLSDASDGGSQQRQHQLLLPLMKVLKIAVQIARALEYMAPTILHRDLKPANVLVNGADSPDPVVKLSDFGLSRLRAATVATLHPEAGTPAYLAPECYDMETGVVTHHADIYSLGVLCWAMLTGRRPWKDLSIPAVAYKVAVLGERPPLEQVGKQRCPPALRRLIRQMWEHDPLRRPAAAEVVLALDGLIRELFDKQQAIARPSSNLGCSPRLRPSRSLSSGHAWDRGQLLLPTFGSSRVIRAASFLGAPLEATAAGTHGGSWSPCHRQQSSPNVLRVHLRRTDMSGQPKLADPPGPAMPRRLAFAVQEEVGGEAVAAAVQGLPRRHALSLNECPGPGDGDNYGARSQHAPAADSGLPAELRRYASVGGGSGTRSSSSSSSGVADEEALARQLEELELDID